MKNLLLTFASGMFLACTASATTVQYSLSATATPNEYTYLFTTNAVLAANQALVVKFPWSAAPPRYTLLENPLGGVGLIILHQPNNPAGAAGDMTLLVPSSTSVPNFSVDALSEGILPASLPFQILQFDGSTVNAALLGVIESGNATLSGVPEPSSAMLSLVGIAMVGSYLAVRRC